MTARARSTEPALLSGEDLRALGDIGPCELIAGSISGMSPRERQRLARDMTLQGTGVLEAFSLPVAALF